MERAASSEERINQLIKCQMRVHRSMFCVLKLLVVPRRSQSHANSNSFESPSRRQNSIRSWRTIAAISNVQLVNLNFDIFARFDFIHRK